jgi:hypothetical protein
MSRFDEGRLGRIVVWTGAALAWAAAITAAALEPLRSQGDQPGEPSPAEVVSTTVHPVLPNAPARGLVILRYTPAESPEPEVRTVYVRQAGTGGSSASVASPAPTPTSSGS